ncbi:unnamed protein product [Plutella xylostella]|uniref:(diamondback moth) hypothetical protein n=1 Tax=Plutella xylostella TaxID=51655 RepID=A0A8S4G5N2_PLUXY|nr:unnamed protein product [Plutella xylostella]
MSVAPAVKRELELDHGGGGGGAGAEAPQAGRPTRAPPRPPSTCTPRCRTSTRARWPLETCPCRPSTPWRPSACCRATSRPASSTRGLLRPLLQGTHRANKHGIYDGGDPQPAAPPPPQPSPLQPSPPRRASDEESGGTPRRLRTRCAASASSTRGLLRDLLQGVLQQVLPAHAPRAAPRRAPLRSPADCSPPTLTPPMLPSTPPARRPRRPSPAAPALAAAAAAAARPQLAGEARDAGRAGGGAARLADESARARRLGQRGAAQAADHDLAQLNELAAERLDEGEEPRRSPSPRRRPDERRLPAAAAAGSSFCARSATRSCATSTSCARTCSACGISLEQGAQLGGVTCDICHKELCSKYFLRVHKHNTHGIPAPPAPRARAPAEPCPLCARASAARGPCARTCWPSTPRAAARLDLPRELLRDHKPYACSYCPFTTDVLAFLFAHERAHAAAAAGAPSRAGARAGGRAGRGGRGGGGRGGAGENYCCSRCEFRAEGFAALEAHLRAAHGGAGALLAVPARAHAPLTMQPFVLEEAGGALSLLPALVFLPVRRRATRRATVTLTLTPA